LVRIVVAIDPAVSTGEDADETGIIVAGKDADGHGYVLADQSARYAPTEWARTAIALYRPALSEPAPNEWPPSTRVMVRKRKSWREATIISRLDPDLWRAEYPGGGSGMFREADIRAYDPEHDATIAEQPRRAKATAPQTSSRSRYAIDPEAIAAGRLPQRAPVVTSAANPHYQKHFDRLFGLAKAGDWDAVRDYEVKGSNSYSKMVARYRQDLLAVHAATEAAP
jgi:hypothetical protein